MNGSCMPTKAANSAHAELDHRRLIGLQDDEQVERRDHERGDRRHHAEEQEGHIRRVAAIAGLHQLLARLLLSDPFGQVELVDDALHVLLRRLAQLHLLAARHPLALALTHLLALERHRLEPFVELVAREQRHRQRDDGRHRRNGGEHARHELGIVQLLDQEFDHDTRLPKSDPSLQSRNRFTSRSGRGHASGSRARNRS